MKPLSKEQVLLKREELTKMRIEYVRDLAETKRSLELLDELEWELQKQCPHSPDGERPFSRNCLWCGCGGL